MPHSCIFAKNEITAMCSLLDREYNKANITPGNQSTLLIKAYSKMAVITLSGWLEDGIKKLIELPFTKLKEPRSRAKLEKIRDGIHGFNYADHFSRVLIVAFGAHGYEYIEKSVGEQNIALLESILGNLKGIRDDSAHSHSVIVQYTPQHAISDFTKIFPILKQIERASRDYRDKTY